MKVNLLLIIGILGITLLFSCGEDRPDSHGASPILKEGGPTIRLNIENKGPIFLGDTLRISVASKSDTLGLDSVEISRVEGAQRIAVSRAGEIVVDTEKLGGGDMRLQAKAYFSDGSSSVRYKEVLVKSRHEAEDFNFEVVRKYPHDVSSFTQGLLIHNGYLYEGTGNYGESRIRKLDLSTGKVLKQKDIESDYFGEGITIFNNKIYQVTYKSGKGFVYDLESFDRLQEFNFSTRTGEGWGLSHNDTSLVLSDGSSTLYFLDPQTLKEKKRLNVFDQNGNVDNLNELEFFNGIIYANIYTEPYIVAIDAATGEVLMRYSAIGMVDRADATSGMDVLNGIAINPVNGNLLITGKYWSKIYEVRPVKRAS